MARNQCKDHKVSEINSIADIEITPAVNFGPARSS